MKPRTLIFTGEGKGKTTAAFGMVLRAAGHGQRVMVVQFLKSNSDSGELLGCAHLPNVELVQIGRGFVPSQAHPAFANHRETAGEALAFSRECLASNRYDLIVLDEICGAVALELIELEEVIALITAPGRTACLVLTGRHASERLMAQADTVTEMRCIRHGYSEGIAAQKGVEF
ncbi:MAG: cob(I)yrinic acid a,c-diamide adenosyltransferase [Verrucomicrobia bacterium]|nr:cob(I)yrinic acid a,c-diamide adenosyltransferase [Verrucomicrobiota bacterium]